MSAYNAGSKVPIRPAPGLPTAKSEFGNIFENAPSDPFSPAKIKQSSRGGFGSKKQPPPRPPPPKAPNQSRSIFGKKKQQKTATAIVKPMPPSTNVPTGTLIDLHSPPSSPQFPNKFSNNSIKNSQVESGFEDDFGSIISSGATTPGFDPWSNSFDFPSPSPSTTPTNLQPFKELKTKIPPPAKVSSKPTIICVPTGMKNKPSRPPPPKFEAKEGSPPMPSIPPPPPPPEVLDVLAHGPPVPPRPDQPFTPDETEPYCVASYDYDSTHPDDLTFKVGDVIKILQRVSADWLKGSLNGAEGIFPESYVEVKVPLREGDCNFKVIAVYPFAAQSWDDLDLNEGDKVQVLNRINNDWLYGDCDGRRGQFPECFVQDITDLEDEITGF